MERILIADDRTNVGAPKAAHSAQKENTMSGGEWTLHFDWGCTRNYSQAPMTLVGDGTLSLPPNRTAKWVENDGKIM